MLNIKIEVSFGGTNSLWRSGLTEEFSQRDFIQVQNLEGGGEKSSEEKLDEKKIVKGQGKRKSVWTIRVREMLAGF